MTIFFYLLTFLGVGALHVAFTSVAPYPLNNIQVSLLLIALMIVTRRYRLALFTTMLMGIVMELYAITPFGIILTSMVASVSAGLIIATTLLSTLQLLGGVLLIAAMTAIFRICLALLLWISSAWITNAISSPQALLISSLAEILLTSLAGALIIMTYAFWSRKSRRRNVSLQLSDL